MHLCMRTTLDLETDLLRLARRKAAEEGRTLTAVVEEALQLLLRRSRRRGPRFRLRWTTRRGTRQPEVDVADRQALYDRLEGRR